MRLLAVPVLQLVCQPRKSRCPISSARAAATHSHVRPFPPCSAGEMTAAHARSSAGLPRPARTQDRQRADGVLPGRVRQGAALGRVSRLAAHADLVRPALALWCSHWGAGAQGAGSAMQWPHRAPLSQRAASNPAASLLRACHAALHLPCNSSCLGVQPAGRASSCGRSACSHRSSMDPPA